MVCLSVGFQKALGLLPSLSLLSLLFLQSRSLCQKTLIVVLRFLTSVHAITSSRGMRPGFLHQLRWFYKCLGACQHFFFLSTPQFLKLKPHHLLQSRGLGETIPWVECFPTINFELLISFSWRNFLKSLLHFSAMQRSRYRGSKGLGEDLS